MQQLFCITGMSCSACSVRIEKAVLRLTGVYSVSVNLIKNNMTVSFDENLVTTENIIQAVINSGYGASLFSKSNNKVEESEYLKLKKRVVLSSGFAILLFYIAMGGMLNFPLPLILHDRLINAFIQFILLLPIIIVNFKYFKNGFKTLFSFSPNMYSLIALGSATAILYSLYSVYKIFITQNSAQYNFYFESAGTILTLVTIGKMLETKAKVKTSSSLADLINISPKFASVIKDKTEKFIPVNEIEAGDIVIVRAGDAIPVDGIIIKGKGVLDESFLTGESIPVYRTVNDKVLSGAVNKDGYIEISAEKTGCETFLSQIIKLAEDTANSKAPVSRFADKVSGIFVPVVICISIITTYIWLFNGQNFETALMFGVSVLVISCPCALGLATPAAITTASGRAAKFGILYKSAEIIEKISLTDTVVLDKTGTVTKGKPVVADVETFVPDNLLKIAASIERYSLHPFANAILEKADLNEYFDVEDFEQIHGMGLRGKIDGMNYAIGNKKLMETCNISINDSVNSSHITHLYISKNDKLAGILHISDEIKPEAKSAIDTLKSMNLKIYLLTGDNSNTAKFVADKVGIKNVFSDVLPQDKQLQIEKLINEKQIVAMAGDGINDAPALAKADIGIAVGTGADIAVNMSDVVLIRNKLTDVVTAIQLGKAALKNIKQNLFWALIYNIICIPVAAGLFMPYGIKLNPDIAALAMSCSSVFVVSNALRLNLFKPKFIGDIYMKKIITIEGMMCKHCVKHVEDALNKIEGVDNVVVSLENKTAVISVSETVSESILQNAIINEGYEVISVQTEE